LFCVVVAVIDVVMFKICWYILIALIFFLHVAALYRSVLYIRHGGS
jgi:hypothetical protein